MDQDQAGNTLWNPDLAPTTAAQRTWRWWHFAALWLGMVIAVPAYLLDDTVIWFGNPRQGDLFQPR